MSRKQIGLAAGIFAVVVLAGLGYYFFLTPKGGTAPSANAPAATTAERTQPGSQSELPAPAILVLDRSALLQYSKVGQDLARQVQAYAARTRQSLSAQNAALESEGEKLQQQLPLLDSDAKKKRVAAFEAKQQSLRDQAGHHDAQVQQAMADANAAISRTVGPILAQIAKERGANMIVDKQAVTFALDPSFDITQQVIDALNAKLSSYKLKLSEK